MPFDRRRDTRSSTLPFRLWLYGVACLVALTAVVGAATRLTGSGLSITEWNVIGGMIPPLTEAHWLDAFAKYKQIPQFRELNSSMTLDGFKTIFWWEWGHRMLARFIGFAFAVPLILLAVSRRLPTGIMPRLLILFALGGLQGFAGWYMVSSGLVDRVDVSQYRLAIHLGLAVLIFAALIWTALDASPDRRHGQIDLATLTRRHRLLAHVLVAIIFLQVLAGALVAGLKAGKTYNTWPLMDGSLVPSGLFQQSPWYRNAFENAALVQFNHRLLAYVILALSLVHAVMLLRAADNARVRQTAALVALAVLLQTALGIWTLLAWVPLSLGVAHQAMALLTVAVAVAHLHAVRSSTRG